MAIYLVSHSSHVHQLTSLSHSVTSHVIFPTLYLSNNLKEKKRKRNINNDLAVLPSHDK